MLVQNSGNGGAGSAENQLQEQLFLAQAQELLQQQQNRFQQLATNTLLAEKLLQNQTTLTALDGSGSVATVTSVGGLAGSSQLLGNGRAGKPPDIVIKGEWTFLFQYNECVMTKDYFHRSNDAAPIE